MPEVVMPRLSDSMEEGTILRWLVSDGDVVSRGQEIVEIETDKAHDALRGRRRRRAAHRRRRGLDAGHRRDDRHDRRGAPRRPRPASAAAPPPRPRPPRPRPRQADEAPAADRRRPPAHGREPVPAGVGAATNGHGDGGARQGLAGRAPPGARVVGRPAVADRHRARPGGSSRPTCCRALEAGAPPRPRPSRRPPPRRRPPAPAAAAAPAAPGGNKGDVDRPGAQPHPAGRGAAHGRVARDRAVLRDLDRHRHGGRPRAARAAEGRRRRGPGRAVVQRHGRQGRARWRCASSRAPTAPTRTARFELHSPRERRRRGGRRRRADRADRVRRRHQVAGRDRPHDARAGRGRCATASIRPPDLAGGTFTVSQPGHVRRDALHRRWSTCPRRRSSSVGAIEPRAVVRDGEIVARHMMTVTMASDHRILYGADAAQFLSRVKALLENPLRWRSSRRARTRRRRATPGPRPGAR